MSLPATCPFTSNGTTIVDGTAIAGLTTSDLGGTGALTFVGSGIEVNTNRAYCPSGGKIVVNAGVTAVIVSAKFHQFADTLLMFRSNSARTAFLIVYVRAVDLRLFDESFSTAGFTGTTTFTGTVNVDDTISIEDDGSNIVVKQNGITRITVSSAQYNTQTYCGLYGTSSDQWDDFSVSAYAIAVPVAVLTKATPTAAYLGGTAGSGGSAPQWSWSTSPDGSFTNFTNGSGISGATSYSLADASAALAGGDRRYAILTDSSGVSAVISYGRWKTPAYVLGIGDSVMGGFGTSDPSVPVAGLTLGTTSPLYHFKNAVKKAANGQRDVIVYDASEGGLKASNWYDSSDTGSEVDARLSTASASGISAGCTVAMVALGINNAYSAETVAKFALDMAGLRDYLLGQGYTAILFNHPTGIPAVEAVAFDKLLLLAAEVPKLCNGTTARLGDTTMMEYLPDHAAAELQSGGTAVHPNDTGAKSVGEAWAFGFANAFDIPKLSVRAQYLAGF